MQSNLHRNVFRAYCLFASILVLLGGTKSASADDNYDPYDIAVTRNIDPNGAQPTSYAEWKAKAGPDRPFYNKFITEYPSANGIKHSGRFDVIINAELLDSLQTSIDQYLIDLSNDGWTTQLHIVDGGTPEELRSFLASEYADGMVGTVLIGDFPVPWYEEFCFGYYDIEQFPCDLFYMDMDGDWTDADSNGVYDDHSGNIVPEIWMGRLTPGPLTFGGSAPVPLLRNYFIKNHKYRIGRLVLLDRALVYVDDDWAPTSSNRWAECAAMAYDDVTLVDDYYVTTGPNYEVHLQQNFEMVLIGAHSSYCEHSFKTPDDPIHSGTGAIDIYEIDPTALFYNLFACSNARYIEPNYMGGWYIFNINYGLASIGSTKIGAMLEFDLFYGPFGEGRTYGEAFFDWFNEIMANGIFINGICWHYGMTLCGDPTLLRHAYYLPEIITEELPDCFPGEPYEAQVEIHGGTPPFDLGIKSGDFPDGLILDNATGMVSGVAIEGGEYAISIALTDSYDPPHFRVKEISLTVREHICGDYNEDGELDGDDPEFMRNYLFADGPPPDQYTISDIDACSGSNLCDLCYLNNHLYHYGPEPCQSPSPCSITSGGNISVECDQGSLGGDTLETCREIKFSLTMNNDTDYDISGFVNGFRLYSPTGAEWSSVDVLYAEAFEPDHFDGGAYICHGELDGINSDTIGFGGYSINAGGLPSGTIETFATITIAPFSPEYDSHVICLDTCSFHPAGEWLWSDGTNAFLPDWEGPYCFTLRSVDVDEDGICDGFDNCPEDYNPDQADYEGDGIGDACAYVCGDPNGDDQVNVGDAVFIITYVFKGGPPPLLTCEGDVNDDGETNVGDAVYLIQFIFRGGPAPVGTCCP